MGTNPAAEGGEGWKGRVLRGCGPSCCPCHPTSWKRGFVTSGCDSLQSDLPRICWGKEKRPRDEEGSAYPSLPEHAWGMAPYWRRPHLSARSVSIVLLIVACRSVLRSSSVMPVSRVLSRCSICLRRFMPIVAFLSCLSFALL